MARENLMSQTKERLIEGAISLSLDFYSNDDKIAVLPATERALSQRGAAQEGTTEDGAKTRHRQPISPYFSWIHALFFPFSS